MDSGETPKKPTAEAQSQPQTSTQASMSSSTQESTDTPNTVRHHPEPMRDYGTIEQDYAAGHRSQHGRRTSESPSAHQGLTHSPPAMTPMLSQVSSRQKKPPNLRRTSTNRKPQRGDYFSVDDDPDEVEQDRAGTTPQYPTFPNITRQGSTVRRRPTQQVAHLPRVDSRGEDEEESELTKSQTVEAQPEQPEELEPEVEAQEEEEVEGDDDGDASDAESFTLADKQEAINASHPFGIRIWKPALYKKDRSVEKSADEDIHSSPSAIVSRSLWSFNFLWTILFGWWLALAAIIASLICAAFSFESSATEYSSVLWGLGNYLFWPFGKFVKLEQDENYAEEDQGEGRSISEYERWQSGDLEYGRLMFGPTLTHTGSIVGHSRDSVDSADETDSLLGRTGRGDRQDPDIIARQKRRMFGRGQWTLGRVVFFFVFYFLVAPLILLVSGICWFMVFWIPMGRVTLILFYHLRKRPLSLTFHRDASYARNSTKPSSILICTYRAVGVKYWKYTVDGTNIFLINFLAVVVFVIFDGMILKNALGLHIWLTGPALLFGLSLISTIPLAYFIGQAVASISAQSSMGMGAAVNAFFSTVVEVYLYCIALNDGKGQLVEGSVIGSIFAGVLLLPGISMCFGAIKRKTQRFNVKSASATSTMLLFATIAAFGPTLFYKIYGSHELICRTCTAPDTEAPRDCRQCYFRQVPAVTDDFFVDAVRPYCWCAAFLLFASYMIGLLFTLRTHAATIWNTEADEKKAAATAVPTAEVSPSDTRHQTMVNSQSPMADSMHSANGPYVSRKDVRTTKLYNKILVDSLRQVGLTDSSTEREASRPTSSAQDGERTSKGGLPHVVPPKRSNGDLQSPPSQVANVFPGLSEEDNNNLVRQVAEIAATVATVAARDATQDPRSALYESTHTRGRPKRDSKDGGRRPSTARATTLAGHAPSTAPAEQAVHASDAAAVGGHDAPNWSRTKSIWILLTATLAYAMIAEILVNSVDVVLGSVDISEKFLGLTLFALVPNTTEFLNAISFAMNGNIALSMEIGSAYALQVALLQLPALVFYSAIYGRWIDPNDLADHTFNLIFPQWDMITVILSVFLLSYMYTEGKSNYFKGGILCMTYLVVLLGFYFAGYTNMDVLGVDPGDGLAVVVSGMWQTGGGRGGGKKVPGKEL